jgi:Fungal specific transcription factor domain
MTLLYPFMLQNSILFESIIALCRASILICVGKTAMDDRALVHHRSRAIKGVSQSLSTTKATNDGVLLSVAMLLTMEYLLGNNAAVAAHRKGLQRMIDMRPDLNDGTPWNTFVKSGLDAYKSLGSFVTGEPPEVSADSHGYIHETFAGLWLDKPIVYPSLPFSPDLCTVLSRLPSGFSELCLSGRLSTQVMQVLASLSATTTSSDSEGFDDTRLDAEIQAMLSALQRLSLMRIASTEKHLTCGLVAYTFQLRRLRALNLFHDPTLKSFIQLIPTQEKPDSIREQQCMVWISVAVAGALNLRTIRMPGTHLILDKVFELYPAMSDWSTMETTLKSFFWTPSILNHWKKCHEAGVFRWKQLANAAQSKPLIDLLGTTEDVVDDEKTEQIDFEQLKLHAQGAPGAMINLMQAARCPFRSRMKMMDSATPMDSPHG